MSILMGQTRFKGWGLYIPAQVFGDPSPVGLVISLGIYLSIILYTHVIQEL